MPTEARDLSVVWDAPLRCRGARMTREQILAKYKDSAPYIYEEVDEHAPTDVEAQQKLFRMGMSYHAGCGADLRDIQLDLLEEHGRGVPVEYECPACGAPHRVTFGAEVPKEIDEE